MDERTLSFLGVRYAYQYQGNLSPNMTKNRHSPEYLFKCRMSPSFVVKDLYVFK